MQIINELTLKGIRLAYCVGEDIPSALKCRKISVAGKIYDVSKSSSSVSFSGGMYALLQLSLQDGEKMPIGEFDIIE